MRAHHENGRATEVTPPVATATGSSRQRATFEKDSGIPTAAELDGLFPNDFLIQRVRELDSNATAGGSVPTCYGAEDECGNPICDGPDVRKVWARAPFTADWFGTHWCADCRLQALHDGYVVIDVIGDCASVEGAA